jgi:hypothetical protein
MFSTVSDWQVSEWLDMVVNSPSYASLHYDAVVPFDPTSTELSGGTYQRQVLSWRRSGAKVLTNSAPLRWRGLDTPTSILAVGVFTSPVNRRLRFSGLLPDPAQLRSVTSFVLDRGELSIVIG